MPRSAKNTGPTIHEVLTRSAIALQACAQSLEGNCDTFTIMRVEMLAKEAEKIAEFMNRDMRARSIRLAQVDRTGTDN